MINVAVVGYGNIGKYAIQAIEAAPDFKLQGVVRRNPKQEQPKALQAIPVVGHISELDAVDVAILAIPTRSCLPTAKEILGLGINTVDSFDLHGEDLVQYRQDLMKYSQEKEAVSVIGAGWDPGTDSVVRALMEIMAPQGLSFTNFGPGLSMGHSVAVKSLNGVQDALSITIPKGAGIHARRVYVQLEPGVKLEQIKAQIAEDSYFQGDELHLSEVESVEPLRDVSHGVVLERLGTSGQTANQQFTWEMRINNPALTSQIMLSAARASLKQRPGAYTLLEIPLLDYFFGNPEELISRLV